MRQQLEDAPPSSLPAASPGLQAGVTSACRLLLLSALPSASCSWDCGALRAQNRLSVEGTGLAQPPLQPQHSLVWAPHCPALPLSQQGHLLPWVCDTGQSSEPVLPSLALLPILSLSFSCTVQHSSGLSSVPSLILVAVSLPRVSPGALACSSLLFSAPSIHFLAYFHLSFIFSPFHPQPSWFPARSSLAPFVYVHLLPTFSLLHTSLCFAFMAFYDVCVTSRLFPFLSPG